MFGITASSRPTDEKDYIANMLSDSLMPLETKLVFESQAFIRREEEDCSVSLRDVRRYKKLVGWFLRTRRARAQAEGESSSHDDDNWWQQGLRYIDPRRYMRDERGMQERDEREIAVVLALAHVYYCRLPTRQKRDRYLHLVNGIWRGFRGHAYTGDEDKFKRLLKVSSARTSSGWRYLSTLEPSRSTMRCSRMSLCSSCASSIACRSFSSVSPDAPKTLSMQLILENLRGKGSRFPELPCVFELRYQCSEDSTSEGIEAIFDSALRKASKDGDDVTYVVVLDEIGLAGGQPAQVRC